VRKHIALSVVYKNYLLMSLINPRSIFISCCVIIVTVFIFIFPITSVVQAEEGTPAEGEMLTAYNDEELGQLLREQIEKLRSQLEALKANRVGWPVEKEVSPMGVSVVEVLQNLRVRSEAGLSGVPLTIKQRGVQGEVIEGPVTRGAMEWYKIKYSDGTIGWSAANWLKVTPRAKQTVEDKVTEQKRMEDDKKELPEAAPAEELFQASVTTFTRGTVVLTTNDTDVYNIFVLRLNDGKVGTQKKGARGKIDSDPQQYQGQTWYRVDFDTWVDGWVPATSLTRENVPSPVPPTSTPTPVPAPVCTLNASPTSITAGGTSKLTWTSQNATSASLNQNIGAVAVNGSRDVKPTVSTTYILTVTNSAGVKATCSRTVTVTPPPVPAPVCTLNASPTSITAGGTSKLTWTSQNATSASLNQNIGAVAVNGSRDVKPTVSTTYTLTVTNSAGVKATCSRTVTVTPPPVPAPVCTLNVSSATITAGGTSKLTWNTTNASKVSINQNIGAVAVNGSRDVKPTVSTTYTLTAENSAGVKVSCSQKITVNPTPVIVPSPTCTLNASPTSITAGGTSKLTWTSQNATSASLNQNIGAVAVNGSREVRPRETITYILTVTNSAGVKATCSRTVTVTPSPTCMMEVTPTTFRIGQSVKLTWKTTNAVSATIDRGIGAVSVSDPNAFVTITPSAGSVYTMTVKNKNNATNTCSLSFYTQ